ncbi:MAG: P1 family peptidase, partial [Clostridia bacterium]
MLDSFKIGHFGDNVNGTGVSVIVAEKGAVGGVSVRGASPATRETDLLGDGKTVQAVNAIVLSGGSAFGLEAACGVAQWLQEKNIGYQTTKFRVPIVCGASLYDLEYKNFGFPDKLAGYEACKNATVDNFEKGEIGVACGTTISKVLGMNGAVKTGLGIQTFKFGDVEVGVIVGVNAIGDIVQNGKIVAGATFEDGSFVDCQKIMSAGSIDACNSNTTIGCVFTNAKLSKTQCNALADLAHDGLARALSPSHTPFDGDCMFVMASGEVEAPYTAMTAIVP